jgi:hypothetical protein
MWTELFLIADSVLWWSGVAFWLLILGTIAAIVITSYFGAGDRMNACVNALGEDIIATSLAPNHVVHLNRQPLMHIHASLDSVNDQCSVGDLLDACVPARARLRNVERILCERAGIPLDTECEVSELISGAVHRGQLAYQCMKTINSIETINSILQEKESI